MCGITGIFHFENQRQVDSSLLKKMTDCISYRGPDAEGFYLKENIGLGHRRLSIIDLAAGQQPMMNEEGSLVVILNGEIYNYVELREELKSKGHRFKTESDTEVVLKAFEEWGVNCQEKFNGMWALAIWDAKKEELFLSRDRIGEKPLHFANYNNSLIFGSEIKSLLVYGVPKRPDLELLELYAVFKSIPAPFSFYKDIRKLMPGHYIIANKNKIKEIKYWDLPEIDEENMNRNRKEINQNFETLFEDSIKIRMRCDVPFGAFLSGGLDSASVVACMNKYTKFPINTFTIGYKEQEYDESRLAALVAKKFKTNHHLGLVEQDKLSETVQKIAFHYDEPFGDSSAIPTGYVSKFAAEKVKMVLTGDGGDEVLSGYSSYQGIKFAQKYQRLPMAIQQFIPSTVNATSKLVTGKYRYKLNRISSLLNSSSKDFNARLIEKQAKPGMNIIRKLINPSIKPIKTEDFVADFMKHCHYKDDFYKQMYLNFKFDLPNDYLVKVDRMSMAYSLEARLPFLDHRLIEYMCKVDKRIKMKAWERKSVLKNTIAKKLPAELMNASKKGFRIPIREWFKNKNNETELANIGLGKGIFNTETLNELIENNSKGKSDNGNLLWSLLILDKMV